jgi:UDP-N-acetylglucosamine 2-epimerase (non-hydrolysing)
MKGNKEPLASIPDYADANVSVKVVKIIQSYTKIVDKVVWGK